MFFFFPLCSLQSFVRDETENEQRREMCAHRGSHRRGLSRRAGWKRKERGRKKEAKGNKKKCVFVFVFCRSFFIISSLLSFSLSPPLFLPSTQPPSSTKNSSPSLSPRITAATSFILIPLRWSQKTPRVKFYVRIFSERSPPPTCPRRSEATLRVLLLSSRSRILLESSATAAALLRCCERPLRTATARPDGRWTALTAESVALACCPPFPEERIVSMRKSSGSRRRREEEEEEEEEGEDELSSSSSSSRTATVVAEECCRPPLSVAGTRCTLWTPASFFRLSATPRPLMRATASLTPSEEEEEDAESDPAAAPPESLRSSCHSQPAAAEWRE